MFTTILLLNWFFIIIMINKYLFIELRLAEILQNICVIFLKWVYHKLQKFIILKIGDELVKMGYELVGNELVKVRVDLYPLYPISVTKTEESSVLFSGTYYDQWQLRVSDTMFAKGPLFFNSRRAQSITKAIVWFIAKYMWPCYLK